jgi:hypothetical protein
VSGQVYYYNSATDATMWEHPQVIMAWSRRAIIEESIYKIHCSMS